VENQVEGSKEIIRIKLNHLITEPRF
jgi:hypothetical protein